MATILLPGTFHTSSRLGTAWVLSHRVSWRVTQNSWFSTLSARRDEQTRATSETMDVNHSRFLAEASPGAKWKSQPKEAGSFDPLNGNGFEKVAEGKGE